MNRKSARANGATFHEGPVENAYGNWPAPVCIVSDGPYGINGYPGDLRHPNALPEWYEPHVGAWTRAASAQTTLWFWCSEIGWAVTHPVLAAHGWEYRGCNVWDKGVGHMAGNVNTGTMRKFPVVTEVCCHYIRKPTHIDANGNEVSLQDWLRNEWRRAGLTLKTADDACGVRNAASRKYLASDHMWYCPPADKMQMLADYANKHGDPCGKPYFEHRPNGAVNAKFVEMRAKFTCPFGVSNVWSVPHVEAVNKIQNNEGKRLHPCEKPLELYRLIIEASSDEGDVVWEPFGGTCPGALVCDEIGRRYFGAEPNATFMQAARRRYERHRRGTERLNFNAAANGC